MTADDCLHVTRLQYDRASGRHVSAGAKSKFIKGPIPLDWVRRANGLPGRTGAVGLSLWFLVGLKKSRTVRVTAEAVSLSGCTRQSYSRALSKLAAAGLVTLERRLGARPTVTVLDPVNSAAS